MISVREPSGIQAHHRAYLESREGEECVNDKSDSATGDRPATKGSLPEHSGRRTFESVVSRCVATAGIVGIGTALGAILIAADAAGWITGLVVSIVTVTLAAMLWRSGDAKYQPTSR